MTIYVAAVNSGIIDTAPSDIYVNPSTGSDSNPGTSGSPYATLAHALAQLPSVLGIAHTIHLADGTYTEGIDISRFSGSFANMLTLAGDTTTPTNVLFTGTVTTTTISQDTSVTVTASVKGPAYVLMQGLALQGNGTPTVGLLVQNNSDGRCIFDRCQVQTSSGNYSIGVGAQAGNVEFRGNVTIQNWNSKGVEGLFGSTVGYTVAGTLTLTGSATPAGQFGIHLAYDSQMILQTASTNITISNVQYGFQLGLHGRFQHLDSGSTITISNSSTPSGSAGVQCTDFSDWSGTAACTWTNLSNDVNLNSISYAESTGTHTFTNVGAATTSQNSVTYGF